MNFSCSLRQKKRENTEDWRASERLMKPKQLGFSLLTEQRQHHPLSLPFLHSSPPAGDFSQRGAERSSIVHFLNLLRAGKTSEHPSACRRVLAQWETEKAEEQARQGGGSLIAGSLRLTGVGGQNLPPPLSGSALDDAAELTRPENSQTITANTRQVTAAPSGFQQCV